MLGAGRAFCSMDFPGQAQTEFLTENGESILIHDAYAFHQTKHDTIPTHTTILNHNKNYLESQSCSNIQPPRN